MSKWFKYFETYDSEHLTKKGNTLKGIDYLKVIKKLQSEFIENFGFNEEYLADLEEKAILVNAEIDLAITGNQQYKNIIKAQKLKLEKVKKQVKINYTNFVITIENAIGREIDENKVSVKKFYSYYYQIDKQFKASELQRIKNDLK